MKYFGIYLGLCIFVFIFTTIHAQDDIEKLYLRKGVKAFVSKNYDLAINNFNQTLVANPDNKKAKKLLAKCYINKGKNFAAKNLWLKAENCFKQALNYDNTNSGVKQLVEQMATQKREQQLQSATQKSRQEVLHNQITQNRPATGNIQTVPIQQPAPIIVTAPSSTSAMDSASVKIIMGLFNNFTGQQKLMEEQVRVSQSTFKNSEKSKDKYLNALVVSSEKNNTMMRNIMIIGAAAFAGFIAILLIVFFVIFHSINKSSELRTVQSNEAIMALLTGPNGKNNESTLQIAGPQNEQGHQNQQTTSIESLDMEDPLQRANAVEAIAAEIIDIKENVNNEKIQKLEEMLSDKNNRVRANAAKAIYDIDKELSINTLKEMLENNSKRMRASGMWALGEIGSEDALELIFKTQNEDDEIVKYNIKIAIGKIISLKRFPITAEQQKQIDVILEQYKDMV